MASVYRPRASRDRYTVPVRSVEGRTRTSPTTTGVRTPPVSSSREKSHSTVFSAPLWNVIRTAYGFRDPVDGLGRHGQGGGVRESRSERESAAHCRCLRFARARMFSPFVGLAPPADRRPLPTVRTAVATSTAPAAHHQAPAYAVRPAFPGGRTAYAAVVRRSGTAANSVLARARREAHRYRTQVSSTCRRAARDRRGKVSLLG